MLKFLASVMLGIAALFFLMLMGTFGLVSDLWEYSAWNK